MICDAKLWNLKEEDFNWNVDQAAKIEKNVCIEISDFINNKLLKLSKEEKELEKLNKDKKKVEKKKSTSYLLGLLNGLNPKWKCFSIFYFFHYFLIRITIGILLLISPFV